MSDELGLHKIGNPMKDSGSITLHLYTPPFSSCKVWAKEGAGQLGASEVGVCGYFSVYGHRSPHLEGRPGKHSRVMAEIRALKTNVNAEVVQISSE